MLTGVEVGGGQDMPIAPYQPVGIRQGGEAGGGVYQGAQT